MSAVKIGLGHFTGCLLSERLLRDPLFWFCYDQLVNAGDSFNRIDDLAVTGMVSVSTYQFLISLGFGAGFSDFC